MAGTTQTQNLGCHSQQKGTKARCGEVSHGEDSGLKVASAVTELQETQGDNERDDDVNEQAGVDVIRRSPQGHERPLGNGLHLEVEWRRVSRDAALVVSGFLETGRLDPFDLFDSIPEFGRFPPNVGPVTVTNARGKASPNRIQHVLRRVDVIGADSSVTSEVLANGGSVLANISEVDLRK